MSVSNRAEALEEVAVAANVLREARDAAVAGRPNFITVAEAETHLYRALDVLAAFPADRIPG